MSLKKTFLYLQVWAIPQSSLVTCVKMATFMHLHERNNYIRNNISPHWCANSYLDCKTAIDSLDCSQIEIKKPKQFMDDYEKG